MGTYKTGLVSPFFFFNLEQASGKQELYGLPFVYSPQNQKQRIVNLEKELSFHSQHAAAHWLYELKQITFRI